MQRLFDTVVDRTRSRLDVPKIRTVFGTAQRPRRTRKHSSIIEAAIETPTFDLTVFELPRAVHRRGLHAKATPSAVGGDRAQHRGVSLRGGGPSDGVLDQLPTGRGGGGGGGVDLNKPRMRDTLQGRARPRAGTERVHRRRVHRQGPRPHRCRSLRLHGSARRPTTCANRKQLIDKPGRTRRYRVPPQAARTIAALLTLRDQVITPILAAVRSPRMGRKPAHWTRVDRDYERIRIDMQTLFNDLAIETPLAA